MLFNWDGLKQGHWLPVLWLNFKSYVPLGLTIKSISCSYPVFHSEYKFSFSFFFSVFTFRGSILKWFASFPLKPFILTPSTLMTLYGWNTLEYSIKFHWLSTSKLFSCNILILDLSWSVPLYGPATCVQFLFLQPEILSLLEQTRLPVQQEVLYPGYVHIRTQTETNATNYTPVNSHSLPFQARVWGFFLLYFTMWGIDSNFFTQTHRCWVV